MAFLRSNDFEIDFMRNPIFGSAASFFVIILKLIFTSIFEIKIYGKNFLDTKKFYFWNPIFINQHILNEVNHNFLWVKLA